MQQEEPTPVNLADLVAAGARRHPDAPALVQPGPIRTELTWAELERRVTQTAGGLAAAGLLAGARLALLGPNSVAFVVGYLAALRAGVVVVPLNPQSTRPELEALLADSGARLLLADPALTPDDVPGVRTLSLTDEGLAALVGEVPVSSPQDPESLAVLLYTAGTSGRPKAAMLSHRALIGHVEHIHALGLLTPASTVLASLPLFHVFGLNAVLGSWLRAGARMVVVDSSTLEAHGVDLADLVRAEGVTNLPLAPPTLHRLLAEDALAAGLGRLETVVSGAAPLPEELAREFTARTGVEVAQGYGLTEAAPGVTATIGAARRGPGHVGRALPGVEIRVGDGSDATEPGEIAVRGDNLFSGYWPEGAGGPDADGWFATGDLGYLLDGELFLVGRSRELVIVNGFNVYPAEVEQAIDELAEVAAVAVVGRPDARTGEQVVAFVVPEESISADELAARVAAHCERRLARFKRPTVLEVVDELPRGATGKVRKGLLRELADTAGSR
ncbi:class I adenylate-forming enzyme family protein [uncultured Friedmanniella sp.]|uniref:class I adenylate-forming enzyme family protein n=1 Tax=uncultured Friedmanniella sp. TaxID=335381 RepID=UPI0035CB901D